MGRRNCGVRALRFVGCTAITLRFTATRSSSCASSRRAPRIKLGNEIEYGVDLEVRLDDSNAKAELGLVALVPLQLIAAQRLEARHRLRHHGDGCR